MPCRNPCRLYIQLTFTYSVGPSSAMWSELGPAPPFHQWECLKCDGHGLSTLCEKWPLVTDEPVEVHQDLRIVLLEESKEYTHINYKKHRKVTQLVTGRTWKTRGLRPKISHPLRLLNILLKQNPNYQCHPNRLHPKIRKQKQPTPPQAGRLLREFLRRSQGNGMSPTNWTCEEDDEGARTAVMLIVFSKLSLI